MNAIFSTIFGFTQRAPIVSAGDERTLGSDDDHGLFEVCRLAMTMMADVHGLPQKTINEIVWVAYDAARESPEFLSEFERARAAGEIPQIASITPRA